MTKLQVGIGLAIAFLFIFSVFAFGGLQDRSSLIDLKPNPLNFIEGPELASVPTGNPVTGKWRVFGRANDIFFVDDLGVTTSMIGAASGGVSNLDEAYDGGGSGAGATINVDAGAVRFTGTHPTTDTTRISGTGSGNLVELVNNGTGKDVDGTSSTWSVTKAGAAVFASIGAHTITGDIDLDDGVTASPSLTFTDATNETAVFSKADSGDLSVTTEAADGLQVLVGNLSIGNGSPGVALDGEDVYIEGTLEVDGAVQIDGAFAATSTVSITGAITLANGLTLDNAVNNTFEWNENSEEIKWTFASNALDLDSTTGVVTLEIFDGSTGTITHAADGAADDLTFSLTGAQDSSLIISSTGTAADAMQITTSAGGLDISVTGAADEDLDITTPTSSINLTASEAIATAIVLSAPAGGIDITTAATFDIDLTATGGKILLIASEAAADQFKIDAQGTVVGDAINLETSDGGIMLNADGAANGDIELNAGDDVIISAVGSVTMGGTDGVGGGLNYSWEDLTATDAGVAASLTVVSTFITTNGDTDEDNVTLADGIKGQIKTFVVTVEGAGGDSVKVTPANLNGGTQITFDGTVGDGCTMQFDGTNWNIISNNGGTIA